MSYIRLSPTGKLLFASYLPTASFDLVVSQTVAVPPLIRLDDVVYQVIESQPAQDFLGCFVDSGGYSNSMNIGSGELLTLFGRGMGPVARSVVSTCRPGKLPTQLAGTSVLINGQPVPLLYVSDSQINLVVPFTVSQPSNPTIQVQTATGSSRTLATFAGPVLTLFRSADNHAVALNEDGSVNSPSNPAKPGSHVVLYAEGGGQTTLSPASPAEVTPIELRPFRGRLGLYRRDAQQHNTARRVCRGRSRSDLRSCPDQHQASGRPSAIRGLPCGNTSDRRASVRSQFSFPDRPLIGDSVRRGVSVILSTQWIPM